MTDNHQITPPPELVQEWWDNTHGAFYEFEAVATQAAQWGADQELEACCEWADVTGWVGVGASLRAIRRPKPPSLKEQALALIGSDFENQPCLSEEGFAILRRALESLPD